MLRILLAPLSTLLLAVLLMACSSSPSPELLAAFQTATPPVPPRHQKHLEAFPTGHCWKCHYFGFGGAPKAHHMGLGFDPVDGKDCRDCHVLPPAPAGDSAPTKLGD